MASRKSDGIFPSVVVGAVAGVIAGALFFAGTAYGRYTSEPVEFCSAHGELFYATTNPYRVGKAIDVDNGTHITCDWEGIKE